MKESFEDYLGAFLFKALKLQMSTSQAAKEVIFS
jgi:hypothetical protein